LVVFFNDFVLVTTRGGKLPLLCKVTGNS